MYSISLGNFDTETRMNAKLDYVSFWDEQAKKLSWFKPWTKTLEWNSPFAKWFIDGEINASYNTLDVHQDNMLSCRRQRHLTQQSHKKISGITGKIKTMLEAFVKQKYNAYKRGR